MNFITVSFLYFIMIKTSIFDQAHIFCNRYKVSFDELNYMEKIIVAEIFHARVGFE